MDDQTYTKEDFSSLYLLIIYRNVGYRTVKEMADSIGMEDVEKLQELLDTVYSLFFIRTTNDGGENIYLSKCSKLGLEQFRVEIID